MLVTRERALADAERADRELAAGIDKGPMHGIPYGLKDIYDTADIRTTVASPNLSYHHGPGGSGEARTDRGSTYVSN